ncbi:MAG: DUF11 domain-containing protein, partial [Euryarchaeota archaeon]|nr:DUF11 domain-containing protein [Euryarchaeota archaeon]
LYDTKGYEYDITDGCYLIDGTNDAYDGMYKLYVNGTYYSGTRSTTEDGGREAVCDPQSIGGLQVQRKVFVPATEHWARYLEILHNPTSAPISAQVRISGDLGSDSSTVVVNSSDGDSFAETGDRWFVTDDSCDGCGDPSLAHVFDGERAVVSASQVYAVNGDDNPSYTWNVVVPAGGTVIIMHFAVQHTSNANAVAAAEAINVLQKEIISGMSAEELSSVLNWNIPLVLGKKAPQQVMRGQSFLYNLSYRATKNITNLTIYDTLDPSLSYLSSTCGGVLSGSTLIIPVGNLSAGSSGSCTINVSVRSTVPQGSYINNTASFVFSINGTKYTLNASTSTLIPNPSVSISKRSLPCATLPGGVVNYTISYFNPSSVTARNLVIKDVLPQGVSYLGDNAGGSYSGGVVSFSIGDLPPKSGGNITIRVNVSSSTGIIENRATAYYQNDDGVNFTATAVAHSAVGRYDAIADASGTTPYRTIQAAVDAAPEYGTVFVCPGTYNEKVYLYKPINLVGAGAALTLLDAREDGTPITIAANVSGFKIAGSLDYGIEVRADNFGIYNNTIASIPGSNIYWAIDLSYSSRGEISGNVINSDYSAIWASSSRELKIENNTITSTWEYGIYFENVYNSLIRNNRLLGSYDSGIWLYMSDNNTIEDNLVRNSNWGNAIYLSYSSGNTIARNTLLNSDLSGIYLHQSSDNSILNNTIKNNNEGITLSSSSGNVLMGNLMTRNTNNFLLSASTDAHHDNLIDTSNLLDGKPIHYVRNASGVVYNSLNTSVFYCIWCENVTVRSLSLTGENYGVYFWKLRNSVIENVTTRVSDTGVLLYNSRNINLSGVSVYGSAGILLDASSDVVAANVSISGSGGNGILLRSSSGNTITGATISGSSYGIVFRNSHNNTVKHSLLSSTYLDFSLMDSRHNTGWNNTCSKPDGWNDLNATGCASLPGASPDFVAEDITWEPYNYTVGSTASFNLTVLNNGSAYAGVLYYSIYVDDVLLGRFSQSVNLSTGERTNISFSTKLPGGSALRVTLDPDNYIGESNETNNQLEKPLPPPGTAPDMVITSVSLSPANYTAGERVQITVTVLNNGTAALPRYRTYYVYLYVDGEYLGSASYYAWSSSILPGQSFTRTYTWVAQGGKSRLTVVADNRLSGGKPTSGWYYESNESNNIFEVTLPRVEKPDLVIKSLTLSPSNISAGDSVQINVTVANLGPGNYSGYLLYLGLYRDSTRITSTSYSNVNIPAGGEVNLSYTWQDAAAGSYLLRAVVDDTYSMYSTEEVNESNNELAVRLNVPKPDLVVGDVSLQVSHPVVYSGRDYAGVLWRYTNVTPGAGWQNLSYDDSGWSTGYTPIGDTGGVRTRLDLNCGSAWFRKVFNATLNGSYVLRLAYDDVVDVWVNGVQVVSGATSSSAYWDHEVDITP